MSSTPREIGTLIVVILKARNLPNKRHIGKQDPYCTVILNNEKRRTKAIKRGGQHPEWDEEVRFSVFEELEDELARTAADGDEAPPPPPPKNGTGPRKIKGGHIMKIQCYADDPREPDLIGEGIVDLTEALTKGETDEWFTIMSKDKYCGEVYLELTFWSNEAPPAKKKAHTSSKGNTQYGGAGSFVPLDALPTSLMTGQGGKLNHGRSASQATAAPQRQNSLPPSLRSSNSLANVDLYVAPYEQQGSHSSALDQVASELGELSVSDRHRSESISSSSSYGHHGRWGSSGYSEGGSAYGDDRPVTPTGPPAPRNPLSQSYSGYPSTASEYQPSYDSEGSSLRHSVSQVSMRRGARYSMPSSSSGFMPIAASAPSGFSQMSHHAQEPTAYGPPPNSYTSVPSQYNQMHMYAPQSYPPQPAPTPTPSTFSTHPSFHQSSSFSAHMSPSQSSGFSALPPPQSSGFSAHVPLPQSSVMYPSYQPPAHPYDYPAYPAPPASAPPQSYLPPAGPPPPPASVPPPSQSAPPQSYPGHVPDHTQQQYGMHPVQSQGHLGYAVPSASPPPMGQVPPPPPLQVENQSTLQPSPSRPLPVNPSGQNQPGPMPQAPQQPIDNNHGRRTSSGGDVYNSVPPPPPPPQQYAQTQPLSQFQQSQGPPTPPYAQDGYPAHHHTPPPASNIQSGSPPGWPNQPQPPPNQPSAIHQPVPPPPPPPHLTQHMNQQLPSLPPPPPPSNFNQSFPPHPGPLPRPPIQNPQQVGQPPQQPWPNQSPGYSHPAPQQAGWN